MKIHGLLLAAAFLPVALAAQEDRYAQITNPKLTSINKEQPRSTFTSYTNEVQYIQEYLKLRRRHCFHSFFYKFVFTHKRDLNNGTTDYSHVIIIMMIKLAVCREIKNV